MKTWHVFAGDHYYPNAGLTDYLVSYETRIEAVEMAENAGTDWARVVGTREDGSLYEDFSYYKDEASFL
jgi:hypothetical protein